MTKPIYTKLTLLNIIMKFWMKIEKHILNILVVEPLFKQYF